MPVYRVSVGSAEYEVTAPDENTAWQWANMTHAQAARTPTPTPTPTPAPTPARPQEEEQGWGEWLADQALRTMALPVTGPQEFARTAYGAVQSLAGLPGSFEEQVTSPGVSQWERTLTKFDEIDRGEYTPPERLSESMQAYLRGQQSLYGGAPVSTPGVETAEDRAAREYAAANPAERRAIRANYEQRLVRDVNRVGEIAREQAARNERLAPYRPTVENLTDVRGPADFGTYIAGAAGQAAPQLGVVMGTAALTRNPAATAAVSGAMAFGEGTQNRIAYAMEQYADLPPEQQARAVARYLEDTNDVTAMVAIAQGALDLAGPVGTILKRQFVKELGEEVVARTAGEAVRQGLRRAPREVGEEFLTGGAQEVVAIAGERSLGEQQGDALTADNFLRVLNAAAAEGVGGLGGSAVFTGVDAVRATRAARAARAATLGDEAPPPGSEAAARTSPVDQEYLRILGDRVTEAMNADPSLTQRRALERVLRDAGDIYQQAVDNIEGVESEPTATSAGVDDTGGGERGVGTDRGPVPPATDAEVAGETVGGGLGRTGTGVPVSDVGTRAGEPALAPITAAQVRAKVPTIEQTFEANASDFEYTYNVTELNAEQKKQAARIVLQSPEVDPYDAIGSVLERGQRLRGAAVAPSSTGLAEMGSGMAGSMGANLRAALLAKVEAGEVSETGGQPSPVLQAAKLIKDAGVPVDAPMLERIQMAVDSARQTGNFQAAMRAFVADTVQRAQPAPTAVEAELAARDQEVSRELLEPEVQTEPTVAETATVEKVTPVPGKQAFQTAKKDLQAAIAADPRKPAPSSSQVTAMATRLVKAGPVTPENVNVEIDNFLRENPTQVGKGAAPATPTAAPTAAPMPTPQQIVDNIEVFAAQEARDRGFDPGMFREGAVDVVRGREPLTDQQILDAQGQEALDAYKAGTQFAQDRVAEAQAAPTATPEMDEATARELDMIDEELSLIAEQRAENAYEGEDPDTMADYEERIAELLARRKQLAAPEQTFEDISATPTPTELVNTPSSNDISALVDQLPETERVNVRARLDRIMARYEKNGDVKQLLDALESLRQDVDRRIDRDRAKRGRDRVRGFERAMEVIYRAERTGQLTPEAAGLVRWLLEQNPAIAEELAISIREGAGQRAAGQYNPAVRLATIFASNANDGTAVHEVLHHTERLMPEKVRNGIRAAWAQRIQSLIALADKTNNTNMREVLGTIVQAYYGDTRAQEALKESFDSGDIPYSVYHLANPSEFWAVNATDLVGKRAKQTGWLGAARTWLSDLIETVKNFFGLPNDAAVITGIKAIMAVESGTIRGQMLSTRTRDFMMYAGKAAHAANRSKLAEAQALEAAGALSGPTGTTRAKTGWFRGVDGEWRFEISDLGMKFKEGYTPQNLKEGRTYLLGQIIDHPELFKHYPDLQKINVVVNDAAGDAGGHWDAERNEIVISNRTPKEVASFLNTLAHELQHAVQTWEGFASGAHYKQYPLSLDAINKALSFLDKNNGQPLFMWGEYYRADRLGDMQNWLQHTRDTVGDRLQQDNDFLRSYGARRTEIATERRDRTRDAEDAWRNGNHPEAVKLRELRDARIAAANRMQAPSLSADERQAALAEYEVAQKAESAQAKYVRGLIDTGVVPLPDMRDLDAADDYLTGKRAEVFARRDELNDRLARVGVDKLMYYLTAGEVEARDTEQRREKLDEEREVTPPYVGERFGSPSDMITVNPYTRTSAAPPQGPPGAPKPRKPVKFTQKQIELAFKKADAKRNKMNRIQRRIASTDNVNELTQESISLAKLVRGDKQNIALLRGVLDTLNTAKWRGALPILSTDDIFRILKGRIPGLNAVDDLIRKDVRKFEATEHLTLAKELETIAKFAKRFPKAMQVLADIQFAAVAFQVDPSLAPNAQTYVAKVDKKSQELRDELAATQDPKAQKDIRTALKRRFNEVESVYKGAPNADQPVYGWNALSRPEFGGNKGRAIFTMMRDGHRNDFMRTYEAHQQHIRETQDPDKVDEALEKLEAAFKSALNQVIYFPLMRYGNYYARVGTGAASVFKMFENETKLNQFKRLMEAAGTPVTDFGNVADLREQYAASADAPIKAALELFQQPGVDVATLRNQVFDIWLQTMSSGDMRSHMAPRSLRAGYSTDILKNYANFRTSAVNNLKRAKYTHKLRMGIERAEDSIEAMPDRSKWDVFIKEIKLRAMAELSPPARDDSRLDKFITLGNRAAFYQYLAQPKVGAIQVTQIHVVALPLLAQKYGHTKAAPALAKYGFSALGGFVASPLKAIPRPGNNWSFDWEQPNLLDNPVSSWKEESDPELFEVLTEGWNEGRDINLFMDTFAQDIGNFGMDDPQQRSVMQELMKGRVDRAAWRGTKFAFNAMGTLMHQMERVNREATYMAALELAYRERRKKGMSHDQAKAEAIAEATDLTLEATFDFSAYNKPRILTTKGGRVAGQFYTFPYMMSSILIRKGYTAMKMAKLEPGERAAAAEVFTGISVNLMLYAGLMGFPVTKLLLGMASMLAWLFGGDDEEEPGGLSYVDEDGNLKWTYNVGWWFQNVWIPKFFGKDGTVQNWLQYDDATAELIELSAQKGPISALTDVDFANSVALDFMFFVPEEPRAETPEGVVAETAFNFFGGATAGMVMDYVRAGYDLYRGEAGRAAEKLPKLVSNVVKAMRFAEQGQRTYSGELVGMPADFWTNDRVILQSLGFTSTEADVRLRRNYEAIDINRNVARAKETVMENFRRAVRDIAITGPTEENMAAFHAAVEARNRYNMQYFFDPISDDTLFESQTGVNERIMQSEALEGLPYDFEGKTPYLADTLIRQMESDKPE